MLTMKAQYSLRNAESYFREHLGVGDYYMEGRSVSGQWIGEGAEKLGLSGVTTEKDFLNLCRNIHPRTDEQLTPRLNSKRVRVDKDGNVHESANRRVFYDFTLSPPKSVSIAALVGNDQRIIEAHDEAVQVAIRELQIYAATRVRKQNQYAHRVTGNVVGAIFRHDTSRDLDPHLHSHCILFNATRDSVEDRWKALEACEMVTAQKFVRNVYYHELVRSLQKFSLCLCRAWILTADVRQFCVTQPRILFNGTQGIRRLDCSRSFRRSRAGSFSPVTRISTKQSRRLMPCVPLNSIRGWVTQN